MVIKDPTQSPPQHYWAPWQAPKEGSLKKPKKKPITIIYINATIFPVIIK